MGFLKSNKLFPVILILLMGTGSLYAYDIYSGKKVGPVKIDMPLSDAFRELKNPVLKELKEKDRENFFAKILQLPEAGMLHYNSLFYCPELNIVLLVANGKVSGLAVTAEEGMLEGVVDVKRGIEPVLVFYGKAGMTIVKKNEHRVYVYKERGIMFFDDNSNGSVDMIIIWKK